MRKYYLVNLATYIFNLFDVYATLYLTATYGLQSEVNPFMRFLLTNNVHGFILYKLIIAGVALSFLSLLIRHKIEYAKVVSWILFGLYGLLTVYYIIILFIF